jgi:hypothetical protein
MAPHIEHRRPASRCIRARALAFGFAAWAVAAPAFAADITVILDHAKLVKLPERVATIVIGNPTIADATVQTGGTLVVTGKGYGITNIIALDRGGNVLIEKSIEVLGPTADVLVVYRGADRESYSCAPACERRLMLGDAQPVFDVTMGQVAGRSGLAQGSQAPAAAPAPK